MNQGATVSSRHNPRFKAALALRDARERRASGQLLVDGSREIGRALDAGLEVREAWIAIDRVRSEAAQALLPRLRTTGIELLFTTPQLLAALAYGERDEGIVVVATEPPTGLERLRPPEQPLLAVVDGVEKPGNLGAILRSADGAGMDGVIVSEPRCDPWNPNAIRASLGTIFSLPLAVSSSLEALAWLRDRRISVVAARLDATLDYDRADLSGAAGHRPRRRGHGARGGLARRRRARRAHPHAGTCRQPQRLGQRGRTLLRGPAAASGRGDPRLNEPTDREGDHDGARHVAR